jgi:hypothetical protein
MRSSTASSPRRTCRTVPRSAPRSHRPTRGGATTARCCRLWVNPIPYSSKDPDAWQSVVGAFDDDLRLFNHTPGSLIDLSEYLHQRTGGYIDSLNQLICQGAQEAIATGVEALTRDVLDDINIGRDNPEYADQ